MKFRGLLAIIIVSFGGSFTANAQYDPLYNQYTFDQLMINPGYTGVHNLMTFSALFRQQWVDIEGAPTTSTLTGHTSIGNNSAGVGMFIVNENYGVNDNTEA